MQQLKKFISLGLVFIFLLSGCKTEVSSVAVTIYPVQYLVERIAGDYIEVNNLSNELVIQAASINDDYETILEESTILFYISGLEPYFDVYQSDIYNGDISLVDLMSEGVYPKFLRYTTTIANDVSVTTESAFYSGSVFDNVDTYDDDPTFWMDPITMIGAAEMITTYLSSMYPMYEDEFYENLADLEIDLSILDSKYQEFKYEGNDVSFVSMSCNFGSWQKSYGFNVYPVCLSKYGALPSDSQLEIIKQKIIDDGVKYIVFEDNLTDDMYELYYELVDELDLIEVSLYNLTSANTSMTKETKDYLTMMYDNLTVLKTMAE